MRIRVEFDGHGLRLTGVESATAARAEDAPADGPGFVVQARDGRGRVLHAVAVAAAPVPAPAGGPDLLPPAGSFEAELPWPASARWIVVVRHDGAGEGAVVARFGLSAPVSFASG